MNDINTFITDNFAVVIIVAIIIVMTIIGYIAKKFGFGEKIGSKGTTVNNSNKEEQKIEVLNEDLEDNTKNSDIEKVDALDTIAPNFNDGGLVIGDVNQNPAITNQELGISDDLYAPFVEESTEKTEPIIEDLKIEEVSLDDDFSIVEKNKKQEEDNLETSNEDLSVPLDLVDTNIQLDDIKIEDIEALDAKTENIQTEDNTAEESQDPIVEEISNLVDSTFVINDATDDFEGNKFETKESSKIEQFDVGESELTKEEPIDFDVEATTNLKLDEINEKIKNLKLEDLDNPNFDEEVLNNMKPKKKKKNISVKSVDEIKKEPQKKNNNKIDTADIVTDLPLPSLSEVAQEDKEVEENDDIWNF